MAILNNKKFLCIVGGQRTGTTALRSILCTTGFFKDHSEIFHLENLNESSFIRFAERKTLNFSSWARYDDAVRVADMYFKHLLSISDKSMHIIDIKLNAWQAFQPVWRYVSEPPFLLEQIMDRKIPIIFTARKNLLDQILSEEIAKKIGKWHNSTSDDVSAKITVPPGLVLSKMKNILITERIMFKHLSNYDQLHVSIYENMFNDNVLNENIVEFVQNYSVKKISLSQDGKIKKNKINKLDVISNYNQLKILSDQKIAEHGRFFDHF